MRRPVPRKTAFAQLGLSLALAAFAVAVPNSPMAAAQAPSQDSVSGSGTANFCGPFQISAQSGPSGENPTGTSLCGFGPTATITCLNVQGNVALVTTVGGPFGPVALRITDNGGAGTDRVEGTQVPFGADCAQPQPFYFDLDFVGDVVVIDAQPLPSTKEECKDGGWRSYGVFMNQGDCVGFVASGGKHGPDRGLP